MSRVAVNGIGVVAPGAIGIDAFRNLLSSSQTAIGDVDRFDTAGLTAHKAGLVRGFKARDFIAPMKMRRMNNLSRYAVAAAKMAIEDAKVTLALDTGVAIGTAFGPVQTSVEYMQEYVEKGAALAPPQLFAESVANAPGSHVAIEWSLRGFNITLTQRESSTLAAAMYAATQVVKGTVSAALIGGVDEVNEMLYSVLDRVGALAHTNAAADEASRPFDRRRNGFVIGEGSVMLVTGPGGDARYGFLSGFGISRDVTASISDWGTDPSSVAAAMRRAVEDAGLALADIDAVYASANSTNRGDRLEYSALQQLYGTDAPPVVATKGYFGEYAAGGGLHLVAALLALQTQSLHASVSFENGDEEMRLDVVRDQRPANLRNILVTSLSAGGGVVCAVVSRESQ